MPVLPVGIGSHMAPLWPRLVREALGAAPGERILDVGCGPGFYVTELLEQVGATGSVVGVDASPQTLALARRRTKGQDNVALHQADATALPVADASFDRALSVQVLEYVSDPAAVDWSTVSWHSADPDRMRRVLAVWDGHLADPCLPRTLAARLRSAGFGDIRADGHTFASAEFTPNSYGAAVLPLIQRYVAGRDDITEEAAGRWAAEQHELGEQGEFSFACIQFCFAAPGPTDRHRSGPRRGRARATRLRIRFPRVVRALAESTSP